MESSEASGDRVDVVLQHLRIRPQQMLPLPWEGNRWLEDVLGAPGRRPLLPEPLHPPEFLAPPPVRSAAVPQVSFPKTRKRRAPRSWRDDLEETRQLAVKAWYSLVSGYESDSVAGKQMSQSRDLDSQFEILVDVLAEKATSTIRSRALSLLGFWKWSRQNGLAPSPLLECNVYAYCKWCRQENLAATKLTRLVEAIKFAKFVLGWNVEDSLISSRRVSGIAFQERQKLEEVNRKNPHFLPPVVVRFLLSMVMQDDAATFDKVVAGFLLFLVFTRARFANCLSSSKQDVFSNA